MELTTPALLFPAISLLLLAYTNRFLALANLVRTLHARYKREEDCATKTQIENLKKRIIIIRYMQLCGVLSFFLCVITMLLIFVGQIIYGEIVFGISLLLLLSSLGLSVYEVQISIKALMIQLQDLDQDDVCKT